MSRTKTLAASEVAPGARVMLVPTQPAVAKHEHGDVHHSVAPHVGGAHHVVAPHVGGGGKVGSH